MPNNCIEFAIDLHGIEDIDKKLKALSGEAFKKDMVEAVTLGAKLILRNAKARAPRGSDEDLFASMVLNEPRQHLKDNLDLSISTKVTGVIFIRIGVNYKKVRHGHLVEFGHWLVMKGKDGKVRKIRWVAARPFLRPAFDSKGESAVNLVIAKIKRIMERYL